MAGDLTSALLRLARVTKEVWDEGEREKNENKKKKKRKFCLKGKVLVFSESSSSKIQRMYQITRISSSFRDNN